MGNCFPLRLHKTSSSSSPYQSSANKLGKVLTIVKIDGKILEYTNPMLVKQILENFSPGCSIRLSGNAIQDLPHDYKLKIGNVYYLIPAVSTASMAKKPTTVGDSLITTPAATMGGNRIKLIITKQELQKLLSMNLSAAEICMLGVIKKDDDDGEYACGESNYSSRWRPVLETIPEGSE